ncbi:MAG: hypothetical protein E4H21_04610 [Thermodesulfobacteriales bacterium]|nr:MAG: hypothetical protein E4H21_04610 [Thermodesulfobacteriales bacterium]
MASYEFVTIWRIKAPIEKVWNEIYHTDVLVTVVERGHTSSNELGAESLAKSLDTKVSQVQLEI